MSEAELELSIVLPCLNEEKTVGTCIRKARRFLERNGIHGEIIVADNGSTDRSAEIARSLGARVVHVPERGYGNALRGGFEAAKGKYIIMGDSDDSHDLENLEPFLEKLRSGYELVVGNRFAGGIEKDAMSWLHKYVGNPFLSFLGRVIYKAPVRDFHCGLRGMTREALQKMDLQTGGMELASEMIVKASLFNLKICEVPTRMFPAGRDRPPHLRTFRDGWRHLRFLLLYSPTWLFAYPGLAVIGLGALVSTILFFTPIHIGQSLIDFHTFIVAGGAVNVGISLLTFYVASQTYAFGIGLLPSPPSFFALRRHLSLEKGLAGGSLLIFIGILLLVYTYVIGKTVGMEEIGFSRSIRLVFAGTLSITVGAQVVFGGFLLSVLGIQLKKR